MTTAYKIARAQIERRDAKREAEAAEQAHAAQQGGVPLVNGTVDGTQGKDKKKKKGTKHRARGTGKGDVKVGAGEERV